MLGFTFNAMDGRETVPDGWSYTESIGHIFAMGMLSEQFNMTCSVNAAGSLILLQMK